MYQTGDVIVYENNGIYQVEAVGTLDFTGDRTRVYYTLNPVFDAQSAKIYCPVEHHHYVRSVMSEDEMKCLLDKIADMPLTPQIRMKNAELANYYKGILATHDLKSYLESLLGIAFKTSAGKNHAVLGQIDSEYQAIMVNCICQEIAYVFHESFDETKKRLMTELRSRVSAA